ncbi:DUF406 family protein [Sansalvadorimonas verongulae]|uniref:DUF406 family protein n=1 Tax=Sansalvadorimonas verongulae TaxID=2172824 RepID=UPI0012BCDC0C|nr:DUF406 family protein [Sansalvadorimonas verongulae]MTI12870.1 DUF406 family protein [Sansalvadorimonas verongulae]
MSISDTTDITCTSCNTMDIGTIIQESDNVAQMTLAGNNKEDILTRLTELARAVENDDACIIEQKANEDESITVNFTFGCAAEKLIFEMRARPLM